MISLHKAIAGWTLAVVLGIGVFEAEGEAWARVAQTANLDTEAGVRQALSSVPDNPYEMTKHSFLATVIAARSTLRDKTTDGQTSCDFPQAY